jgi:UDP-glucose 4-epimerase
VVLRYANVYGPRQDPHGEAGVIAIFIQRIRAGLAPTIFGDGEQVRDFVYVADVVRANLLAHAVAVPAGDPLVLNIATGQGTTVTALWRALSEIATRRSSRTTSRPGPAISCAACSIPPAPAGCWAGRPT